MDYEKLVGAGMRGAMAGIMDAIIAAEAGNKPRRARAGRKARVAAPVEAAPVSLDDVPDEELQDGIDTLQAQMVRRREERRKAREKHWTPPRDKRVAEELRAANGAATGAASQELVDRSNLYEEPIPPVGADEFAVPPIG